MVRAPVSHPPLLTPKYRATADKPSNGSAFFYWPTSVCLRYSILLTAMRILSWASGIRRTTAARPRPSIARFASSSDGVGGQPPPKNFEWSLGWRWPAAPTPRRLGGFGEQKADLWRKACFHIQHTEQEAAARVCPPYLSCLQPEEMGAGRHWQVQPPPTAGSQQQSQDALVPWSHLPAFLTPHTPGRDCIRQSRHGISLLPNCDDG